MIHLYTGNGKGKTTAAIGLAVRHAGTGGHVVFVQFLKSAASGEISVLESIPHIIVLRNQVKHGFSITMTEEQKRVITKAHNKNLSNAMDLMTKQPVTMLVLDELCAAYSLALINRNTVDKLVANSGKVELVITGRDPSESFIKAADYITEMKLVRHPYEKGVPARKGVEF